MRKQWKERLREPLVLGIITAVAGVAFIVSPMSVLSWILRIVGALLLLLEIFRISDIVRAIKRDAVFVAALFSEIMITLLASVLLFTPISALRFLSTAIGLYLAVTSAMAIYAVARERVRFGIGTVISIITAVLGLWLVIYPASLSDIIGIFIGVALIIKGCILIVEGLPKAREKKKSDRDYYSDDFVDKSHEL